VNQHRNSPRADSTRQLAVVATRLARAEAFWTLTGGVKHIAIDPEPTGDWQLSASPIIRSFVASNH
jgi:hypothetical protein